MLGLTSLGVVHTLISLVALGTGFAGMIRDRQITIGNRLGQVYWVTTVLTCVTGFGIFQHGGFGKAHALGIITLLVLGIAAAARKSQVFGKRSLEVETVSYTATLFFHMVPTITETSTRIPLGDPWQASPEAPTIQALIGVTLVLFAIVGFLQVRRIRVLRGSLLPLEVPLPTPLVK